MSNDFLKARCNSFLALGTRYDELYRMLETAGLQAVSGDIQRLTPWESVTGGDMPPTYWPMNLGSERSDAGVIEVRHPDLGWVGRIHVNSESYYGTSVVGGNHDWSIGELRDSLEKSVAAKRQQHQEDLRLMS